MLQALRASDAGVKRRRDGTDTSADGRRNMMTDFWKIYDVLIDGIDPSVRVDKVISGHTWTAVMNDAGGFGMAMTTPGETRPRTRIDYQGMPVRAVADLVKSWNFLEASIGMAAINSFYNTKERMDTFGWEQPDTRFCSFDLDMKGKTIGMVGHLKHKEDTFEETKQIYILEMNAWDGDYPASACEVLIPECDIVMITGSALINKTLPRLLELSQKAFTILTGPSTPMAPQLVEAFDIQRVAGFIPADADQLWQFVSAGCCKAPYEYGMRFYIDRKGVNAEKR